MKAGAVVSIGDTQRKGPRGTVTQPGLPGRWAVWSHADGPPGAHYVTPLDADAKATGVKYATVRVLTRATAARPVVELLTTDPVTAMPAERKDPR